MSQHSEKISVSNLRRRTYASTSSRQEGEKSRMGLSRQNVGDADQYETNKLVKYRLHDIKSVDQLPELIYKPEKRGLNERDSEWLEKQINFLHIKKKAIERSMEFQNQLIMPYQYMKDKGINTPIQAMQMMEKINQKEKDVFFKRVSKEIEFNEYIKQITPLNDVDMEIFFPQLFKNYNPSHREDPLKPEYKIKRSRRDVSLIEYFEKLKLTSLHKTSALFDKNTNRNKQILLEKEKLIKNEKQQLKKEQDKLNFLRKEVQGGFLSKIFKLKSSTRNSSITNTNRHITTSDESEILLRPNTKRLINTSKSRVSAPQIVAPQQQNVNQFELETTEEKHSSQQQFEHSNIKQKKSKEQKHQDQSNKYLLNKPIKKNQNKSTQEKYLINIARSRVDEKLSGLAGKSLQKTQDSELLKQHPQQEENRLNIPSPKSQAQVQAVVLVSQAKDGINQQSGHQFQFAEGSKIPQPQNQDKQDQGTSEQSESNTKNSRQTKTHLPDPTIWHIVPKDQIAQMTWIQEFHELNKQIVVELREFEAEMEPNKSNQQSIFLQNYFKHSTDDIMYYGEWYQGLRQGFGELFQGNTAMILGQFQKDKLQTDKVRSISQKKCVEGSFKDGKLHGDGIMIYFSGQFKQKLGNFRSGKQQGDGTIIYSDGSSYDGNFEDDMPKGQGILTFQNGITIESSGWNNKLATGEGVIQYADGSQYTGALKNNNREGFGVIVWPKGNKAKFEGLFKNNLIHGQGTLTTRNGKVKKGNWEADKFLGWVNE